MKFVIAILLLSFSLLGAENHQAQKEDTPFSKYQEEQSPENFEKALKFYNNALKENKDDGRARLMLSYTLLVELYKTLDHFDTTIDSLKPGMKFQYANTLLSLGQFEKAIKIYDKINKDYPKWSCPWRHKGEAEYKRGSYAKAEEAFLKAIESRKTHYDAYVWLAKAQKAMGKNEIALKSLETGLSYKGKDIEDAEEEVSSIDVSFLHLELLKACNKEDEFSAMKKKVKEIVPDDERWENLK